MTFKFIDTEEELLNIEKTEVETEAEEKIAEEPEEEASEKIEEVVEEEITEEPEEEAPEKIEEVVEEEITEEPGEEASEETAEESEEEMQPELDEFQIRAAALAYARYLKENDLVPGEQAVKTEAKSEETGPDNEEALSEESAEKPEIEEAEPEKTEETGQEKQEKQEKEDKRSEAQKAAALKKIQKREEEKARQKEKFLKGGKAPAVSITGIHDNIQDGIYNAFGKLGRDIVRGAHKIGSSYSNTSRRVIGLAIMITGLLAAGILIVFDIFTVYEYSYNGKVLGYVKNQEEVTDVLDVAGKQLNYNSSTEAEVQFVANQNVTFSPVDGRGKSTDDSDTVVNKLIYMTDIETEAYAVYDGDKVVAVVKDQKDADNLLLMTKADLSTPDRGMELVSSEFTNELSVKPVNVLLGSVQSNVAAQTQMTNGGDMNIYHVVEDGETIQNLAAQFGVEEFEIYDESNKEPVTEIEMGDRVCIRLNISPVSVKVVEKGKLKEVIEYETIKKESDEYYKGDSFLEQEGQDGVQIFNGTITKVGGMVVERKNSSPPEVIKEKKDKIIVVGTAERPKTAATGTFIVPLDTYVVTSEWGGRWGRMHEGIDLAAPTGTPIHASDGGKIIKANYWSGHGLCVEVDHGNGVITRYSHCSAVFVSIGDLVYQGQHIANVGNTGHSFGSHCHFEVRINDVSQNPRNYINP